MIAKVPLLDDRAAAMAIGASNLALADLTLEHRDGHLSASQLNDPGSLLADVIEIQHDWISHSAVHAGRLLKMLDEKQEVAAAERPRADRSSPVRIHSPGSRSPTRPPAMAVRTDKLTVGHFGLNPFQPVALSDELADLHPLRSDVIELKDRWIRQPAIRTLTRSQDLEDVRPRGGSSLVARAPALPSMKVAAVRHVCPSAFLASRLPAMEVRREEDSSTAVAQLRRFPAHRGPYATFRLRRLDLDVPSPHACGGERNAQFPADLAERTSLAAQLSCGGVLPDLRSHRT